MNGTIQRVCNRENVAPFLKISGQPDTFSLPAARSEISNARFLYLIDSFIRRPLAAARTRPPTLPLKLYVFVSSYHQGKKSHV